MADEKRGLLTRKKPGKAPPKDDGGYKGVYNPPSFPPYKGAGFPKTNPFNIPLPSRKASRPSNERPSGKRVAAKRK